MENKKPIIAVLIVIIIGIGYYGYTVLQSLGSLSYTWSPGPFEGSFTGDFHFNTSYIFWLVFGALALWALLRMRKVWQAWKSGLKIPTKYIKLEKVKDGDNLYKIITEGQDPRNGKKRQFKSLPLPFKDEDINNIPETIFVHLHPKDEKVYIMDTDFLKN